MLTACFNDAVNVHNNGENSDEVKDNPVLPRTLTPLRGSSYLSETAGGFTSRFLKQKEEPAERYSNNPNLSLRAQPLASEVRGAGLRGVLARSFSPLLSKFNFNSVTCFCPYCHLFFTGMRSPE